MSIRNKILFSVGCFITAVATFFISFLSYPIATLIQDLLYDLFHFHYQLLGEATKYLLSCISSVIAVAIPLILLLLFNLLSRKAGRAEGCISPAYLFVYTGVSSVVSFFSSICIMLLMRYTMDYKLFSVISVFFAVFSLFAAAAVMVVLFLIDGKRIKNLNQKVSEAIADDSIISDTPKMFSVGRIIVLAVFIISYLSHNLIYSLSYKLIYSFGVSSTALHVILSLFLVIAYFAAVLICNLIAGKKNCENKLPFATMFIPMGTGFISSVISNLYSSVYMFIKAFEASETEYLSYSKYYDDAYSIAINELSDSVNVINIILGIITIVLFTLLVFRHENKQYNAMVNGKFYGKKKEKNVSVPSPDQNAYQQPVDVSPVQDGTQASATPVYQQQGQVYQQPVQVIYLQPGQTIYQQPGQPVQIVYQQPGQPPVYGQPVQAVYQQPVQPETVAATTDDPTATIKDESTATSNGDPFNPDGNYKNQ